MVACSAGSALLPAGAFGQNAASASETTLEEVVVTAEKRLENIQDVPISVTAFTERTLELFGATDQLGYFFEVPGLSFQSQGPTGDQHGNVSLSLRGIAATAGANTVGFYVNETPMHFVDPNLFDVNRIEVLRGPQGTLYGASSMGGTIKVITNEPDPAKFEGKIDVAGSRTEHAAGNNVDANVVLNVPIMGIGWRCEWWVTAMTMPATSTISCVKLLRQARRWCRSRSIWRSTTSKRA